MVKIYVNGISQTLSYATNGSSTIPQNTNGLITSSSYSMLIGLNLNSSYADWYLAEINFVDGQALTPSSFTTTDTTSGQLVAKKYTGTYGTNGFYLPFTDNSALTTASNVGLGKDFSGNGNYWATNNISITAGATYDSFTDVPTLTGPMAGNFATLNPVAKGSTADTSNGSLQTTSSGRASGSTLATVPITSDMPPIYWETAPSINVTNSDPFMAGLVPVDTSLSVDSRTTGFMTYCYTNAVVVSYQSTSAIFTLTRTLLSTDVMQFAYKPATNELWLGINDTWYNSTGGTTGNPSTGANPTKVVDSSKTWVANLCVDGPSSLNAVAKGFPGVLDLL
jgi:hypothetical protein